MRSISAPSKQVPLLLGQNGAQHMAGQIDEVQIWNTAVNVSVFYGKYLKGTEQGLVRYYKCDQGKGRHLKDSGPQRSMVSSMEQTGCPHHWRSPS